MGTAYHVKWIAADDTHRAQIKQQIDALLVDINQQMSTYIKDSELSLFNAAPSDTQRKVSAELYEVLSLAQQISERTHGAYDISVGPLVNLWGFGPKGRITKAPSDADIAAVRARVGYQKLSLLADQTIAKSAPLYLDLSSIAKGYAVDKLAQLLESRGVKAYLVEIGGELRTLGTKPNGADWRIAIESPTAGRTIQKIVDVSNIAVATSGDYRNYFEQDGVRYSHTIDTQTGKPVSHNLASVTVLAVDCATADALATSFLAMGTERALEYATKHAIEAFFIIKEPSGFVEKMTAGFAARVVQ